MNIDQRMNILFTRFLNGDCTPSEWEELLVLIHGIEENDAGALSGPLFRLWEQARDGELPSSAQGIDREKMYAAVTRTAERPAPADTAAPLRETPVRHLGRWWRLPAAAAIAIIFSVTGVLYLRKDKSPKIITAGVAISPDKIKPGINKAVLILGNGQKIVLDSSATGAISRQGNTVVMNFNGRLAYEPGANNHTNPAVITFNTVATERANQYELMLPDGSTVWLNAVSSIRFPTAFTGKDRTVSITGEAYFDIKKNAAQPFHVNVNGMDIEVLGTHFNVNAYRDEAVIKTSLLEGSVKITHGGKTGLLTPGEEANLTQNGELKIAAGDVEGAAAWKNGYFQFDKAPLALIMRQIGRWYDLDIRYDGPIPDRLFQGKLQRSLPLSSILHLLQKGDIHFKTEGKILTVTQ